MAQQTSYLAVDLGAESGRLVLGQFENGVLKTTEVRRFPNEPVEYNGSLYWDVARLWLEVQRGLKSLDNIALSGIGVDTWGVDYAFLDESGELLGNPYHYRDRRTTGIMEQVCQRLSPSEIYAATGIQFLPFNTLYQLYAAQMRSPRMLEVTAHLLTVPDLFHYWLSGNITCEYTNATTTQMVDSRSRTWAKPLLERLSLPSHFLGSISAPGSVLGTVLSRVSAQHAGTPVIAPACHDTGSAVAAVYGRGDTAFLSSGTWSLLGTEEDEPILSDEARQANFTNEGGVCDTIRFLKNVMGLWLLQGCRKTYAQRGTEWTYENLMRAASQAPRFQSLINPDDGRFLNPSCMLTEIEHFCDETDQPRPQDAGGCARAILESLALRYSDVLNVLEGLTGRRIKQIRVIGGGSSNDLLNQFTADATGCRVVAGPAEATALGNIAMQMLATGAVKSLREAREIIEHSQGARCFEPRDTSLWEHQKPRFAQYLRGTICSSR